MKGCFKLKEITLYKNMIIYVGNGEIINRGYVVVADKRFIYVGESLTEAADAAEAFRDNNRENVVEGTDFDDTIDLKNKLLMPGFVNTHSHLPMTLMRGYGENLPLQEWLFNRIFPFEACMNDEAGYVGTVLGLAEMIRFGTVSVTDSYDLPQGRIKAIEEAGIKASISRMATKADGCKYVDSPAHREFVEIMKSHHNACDGRIKIHVGIHAEYTTDEEWVRDMAATAKEYGVQMELHLSETLKEHEECKGRHDGKTPAEYMCENGVFDVPCTAAHCVFAEDSDIDIFRKKGVTVAMNPTSNLKLGSGIAPLKKFLEKGVRVTLGTDSVASNNNLNPLKEMNLAALLAKGVNNDPALVGTRDIIRVATVNGFASQGRVDCGEIKEGNRADFIVVDIDQPHMWPRHSMETNIVYSMQGSDVRMTVVDGEVLYKNGEFMTIDVEKAQYDVVKQSKLILEKVNSN